MATAPTTLFAIAAPGLEPLVAAELTQLGEQPRLEDGGVAWTGDARSMMRANLWLRTASRVVVRIAQFPATAFHELERQAKRIDWGAYLGQGVPPEFRVTARKSKLYHSDAIAERLTTAALGSKRKAQSPKPKAQSPHQLFVVRMHRDVCTISADTSGALLHMRGYRQAIGKAPLRETLAAAMLLAAEWSDGEALLDPLCGSGTIAIEGALIARRMAPGRSRDFAFMRWPGFDADAWRSLLSAADRTALPHSPVAIVASDRDAGAIASATSNAQRAGVVGDVEFSQRALSGAEPAGPSGLVATNPPYGKRASDGKDVRDLYAQLGKLAREKFANWRLVFLSPDQRFTNQVAIPLTPLIATTNGGIRVAIMASSARFLQSG